MAMRRKARDLQEKLTPGGIVRGYLPDVLRQLADPQNPGLEVNTKSVEETSDSNVEGPNYVRFQLDGILYDTDMLRKALHEIMGGGIIFFTNYFNESLQKRIFEVEWNVEDVVAWGEAYRPEATKGAPLSPRPSQTLIGMIIRDPMFRISMYCILVALILYVFWTGDITDTVAQARHDKVISRACAPFVFVFNRFCDRVSSIFVDA